MANVTNSEITLWYLPVIQYVINVMVILLLVYVIMKFWSYQQIFTTYYRSFISFDSRLESFNKCNTELKQGIISLCESGFFYTGDGETDEVTCFSCGVVIFNWEYKDDPWTQHAFWSRDCRFLRLCKGEKFVEIVHTDKKPEDIVIPKLSKQN